MAKPFCGRHRRQTASRPRLPSTRTATTSSPIRVTGDKLKHCIGGLTDTMNAATLLFVLT